MDVAPVPVTTADLRFGGSFWQPLIAHPGAPLLVCVHGSGCSSRYFDLNGNSLVAAAMQAGIPTLLVDRPGHGRSPAWIGAMPGSPVDAGVAATQALVAALRATVSDLASRPLALIGHSFGGAVALVYAAYHPDAVAAVSVSGIGDRSAMRYAAAMADNASAPGPQWLFGPGSSYDWRGVTALRAAAAPWRADELVEMRNDWPRRWADVAAKIRCPVQVRFAEYERIWETTPDAATRIEASFIRASRIDLAIAPDGGHLYEAHLRGPELIAQQIEFVRDAIVMTD